MAIAAMWTSVCLFVLLWSSLTEGEPVVETPLGRIIGKVDVSVNDVHVETFLGIPFAKPPVGDLRFDYPQAVESFGDVLEAKQFGAVCAQAPMFAGNGTMSEDCLFLNVYRPAVIKKGDNVAVLVSIHGGAFAFGSTVDSFMSGAPMAAVGNIIVVTINYRLGILGFADMGTAAPGNLGFYDQIKALEWLKENIIYFGGDPNMVTVVGVSAGSMSVNALIISPISRDKNLFQAAIMDGGLTGRGFFLPPDTGLQRMKIIANKLNCPTEGGDMVKCLRKVDDKVLTNLSYDPAYSPIMTFHPTFDGKFLAENFEHDLQVNADKYSKVKLILGTAKDEGSMFVRSDFGGEGDPDLETEEDFLKWCRKLSHGYKYQLNFKDESLRKSVVDTYMRQNSGSRLQGAATFLGDGTFVCPVNAFVKSYSRYNTGVYVYRFDRLLKGEYRYRTPINADKFGAFHGTPFVHFMGTLLPLGDEMNQMDKQFSIDSLQMVAEFVKTHKAPIFRGVRWPDYGKGEGVMVLDETPSVRGHLIHERNCEEVFSYYEKGLEINRAEKNEL